MKATTLFCLCGLLACGQAAQVREQVSPVTRVVNLLKNLAKQIEKEGKVEEDLYESFVCWGKSVIAQKTDSNTAANSRMDSLKTYVADLDAGKIDLTSEGGDLEKEIEEMTAELDAAEAMRNKEKSDFASAKTEMNQAISALGSAVKVLKEATKDNKKGAMLAYHAELNGGMAVLEAESANLNSAVELGERFLTKADSLFLRRVLTGDARGSTHGVPDINKKATFKMAYKTRSTKIQDVLARLKGTFEQNLKDATGKEKDSQDSYDKLSKSKGDLLKKAQDAQKSMDVENGARGKSKSNAQEEIKALTTQVKDDSKFIKQTQDSLDLKKKEWDARTVLRNGELGAVSKAINILYNDDARDNFKKSFASQEGFFFLQEASRLNQNQAVAALKEAAGRTGDDRLSALAALCAQADPSAKKKFAPVLKAIDKMLTTLADDEKNDIETKETCEKERMANTRKALLAGRSIDEKTDKITKLEGEIKDLEENIKKLLDEKQQTQDELDAADKLRKEENAAWKQTDSEDSEAALAVKNAKETLTSYYDKAFKFVQVSKAPTVVEGEAPPPPPPTWDTGSTYGGKKGESTGIISILEMVYDDIKKDSKKAKAEEDSAQKEFDQFKEDSEAEMKALQKEADKQKGIKGGKQTDRIDTVKSRKTKTDDWESTMNSMENIAPNCEYYTVNFKIRASNRQAERDGLNKAKAILSGGTFKLL